MNLSNIICNRTANGHRENMRMLREYAKDSSVEQLVIRSDWETIHVSLHDIMYIEIKLHNAFVHTAEETLRTARTIKSLEAEIGGTDFLRCHRSFLVNQRYIAAVGSREFILQNGEVIPIGSTVVNKTKQLFAEWCGNKA